MYNWTKTRLRWPSSGPTAKPIHSATPGSSASTSGDERQFSLNRLRLHSPAVPFVVTLLLFGLFWTSGLPEVGNSVQAQTGITSSLSTLSVLPAVDTYIAAGAPERRRPDLRVFWVGYNQGQASLEQHSLLGFDLTALPANSQISSARLSLHLSATTNGDEPLSIAINRIRGAWAEEINWQEMAAALDSSSIQIVDGAAAAPIGTEFVEYAWDVTALVEEWQSSGRDGSNQLSLLLRGEETTTERERAFWSSECSDEDCGEEPGKRPLLTIEFNEAVATALPIATQPPTEVPTETPVPTTSTPEPTTEPTTEPNQPVTETAEPSQSLTVSVRYRGADGQTDTQFPAQWSAGELLDVELLLEQTNALQALNNVVIASELPQGSTFISATQSGSLDEENELINWSGITVPATGSQTIGFTLEKPEPIAAPRLIISQTEVSNIFIFDATTESGTDLQYQWNFNDGTPIVTRPDQFFPTATIQRPFLNPGTYLIELAIYNHACRFLLSEELVVPPSASNSQTAGVGESVKSASHFNVEEPVNSLTASSISGGDPATDGTANLPWCPDTLIPAAPQVIVTWTEAASEQERVQIINPKEGIYLPHFSSGR